MAEESSESKKRVRKAPTKREQSEQIRAKADSPKRIRSATSKLSKPADATKRTLKKEYYLPLPDNRFGRFFNKRRSLIPSYFKKSFAELKLVTWPNRRDTWRLTFAVFVFAILIGCTVAAVDKGLEELFKNIILDLK